MQLINPRSKSSCSVSNGGDVFIAGGFGRGWGLESWNPEKNTVVKVSEYLPTEIEQSGPTLMPALFFSTGISDAAPRTF
jgi:hypothetical protein